MLATAVTAIGGFLFGYDTAVINGAISYLKADMGLDSVQEGTAGASAILGCIPGALCAGFLSDRFGRKKLLFLCALLYAASGILSALPRTFEQFLAARFLSGLGIGASSMICPVYIAEIAPEKSRGRLGTLFQLGIVFGIFLTLFINKVVQGLGDEAWNTAWGWRWMLGLEAVPALVFLGLALHRSRKPTLAGPARARGRGTGDLHPGGRRGARGARADRDPARWLRRRRGGSPSCSRASIAGHS